MASSSHSAFNPRIGFKSKRARANFSLSLNSKNAPPNARHENRRRIFRLKLFPAFQLRLAAASPTFNGRRLPAEKLK
jgi:hypothetical protein